MCFGGLPLNLIMSPSIQFGFSLGMRLYGRRFGYSQRTFGISKLFRKIILMFVQNKLVLNNSSVSHGYVCMSVEIFLFLVKM
jgi:hypothetical protein